MKVQGLDRKQPLKSPVGPPFSPPVGSTWNELSLTPPITTSSKAPHASSLTELPETELQHKCTHIGGRALIRPNLTKVEWLKKQER